MLITREELAAIKQQAVAEYPNECCGVILVRGAERRHMPCRNVQDQMHARDPITFSRTARNAYYMDPIDALKLNRLADEGFAFAVIYHSHPNAGAYFSETDRGQALIRGEPAYPGAVYVVVSVVGSEAKALAAYRWNVERCVFERADAGDLDPAEPAVSRRLLAAAERRIPGGVNSPVRAPSARATNRGSPPTERNARTGLLTPPGMRRSAAASRRREIAGSAGSRSPASARSNTRRSTFQR